MRKYIIKYTFEFFVIVLGISVSFLLEDARQKRELKYLSQDLVVNLLNEVSEIESYLKEREVGFKGDKKLIDILRGEYKYKLDSLIKTIPVMLPIYKPQIGSPYGIRKHPIIIFNPYIIINEPT